MSGGSAGTVSPLRTFRISRAAGPPDSADARAIATDSYPPAATSASSARPRAPRCAAPRSSCGCARRSPPATAPPRQPARQPARQPPAPPRRRRTPAAAPARARRGSARRPGRPAAPRRARSTSRGTRSGWRRARTAGPRRTAAHPRPRPAARGRAARSSLTRPFRPPARRAENMTSAPRSAASSSVVVTSGQVAVPALPASTGPASTGPGARGRQARGRQAPGRRAARRRSPPGDRGRCHRGLPRTPAGRWPRVAWQ